MKYVLACCKLFYIASIQSPYSVFMVFMTGLGMGGDMYFYVHVVINIFQHDYKCKMIFCRHNLF